MAMNKETILPVVAIGILVLGIGASLYVHATEEKVGETVIIGEQKFSFTYLFQVCQQRSFEENGYSGIALDDIVQKIGLTVPEDHGYTIIGADAYQKTVTWENLQHGLLTEEKRVIFSDLPKAFRVRDVVEIQII
jgi:hypothetical protein